MHSPANCVLICRSIDVFNGVAAQADHCQELLSKVAKQLYFIEHLYDKTEGKLDLRLYYT